MGISEVLDMRLLVVKMRDIILVVKFALHTPALQKKTGPRPFFVKSALPVKTEYQHKDLLPSARRPLSSVRGFLSV